MTSRVSFLRLIKETLRRHIAAVLITVLVFVIHIIAFFLNVQNALSTEYVADTLAESVSSMISAPQLHSKAISEVMTQLSYPNLTNGVIAMLVGAYLAFDFLRYMHSKRETDFYDSLPIRKQKWFAVIFTSCFTIFTICCVVTTGLELAIIYGTGYGSALILQNMLWNLLCMIGIFLACWFTTALAMIMTGHSIIAFLGVGVIASYVPVILYYLVPVYAEKYFTTYINDFQNTVQYYFSPATLMYKTIYHWNQWDITNHWTYLVGCFAFAAVVGLLSYFLFLRRPSETAGRAMAFEKVNFIIRFLIVIPVALYIGIFLSEMSSFAETAWLVFGVIFGAFLIHGILECIFQFDIKALISKKRQLLISIVLCLGFVFIFWADVFGYDEYLPDENDVEAIYIDAYDFDKNYNDYDKFNDGVSGENITDALTAISEIMNEPYDQYAEYSHTFNVEYKLKNGQIRRRCYTYSKQDFPQSLEKLYLTEDFKNDYCILFHLDKVDIKSVTIGNGVEGFELDLSTNEWNQFVEIYLNEYTNLSLTHSSNNPVVYDIGLEFAEKNKTYNLKHYYSIYPNFVNTIQFLNEHGVVSFAETDNIVLENLEIFGGKFDNEYTEERYVGDLNILNELKPYMIVGDFMFDDYNDEYIYCDLRYKYEDSTKYTSVFVKDSDLENVLGDE